ncbi:acyl-CoA dehydrogenase [Actinomycetospora corticicola]|uniref:Alkylation response protein AidB-like acyl-CoA dehydrogenase n=1 Tax=Actinomycetospora corticicola TaxID=663602 RepID=A0A7Y9E246_9PSEU|nr:acyl-CoA dehydrogenase family protein [Actinomycetospora corticicola]NYD39761.1 alkylation response protein AidB-like acyl-CoA dehydrogenase [Actinomycetospora corticicola]
MTGSIAELRRRVADFLAVHGCRTGEAPSRSRRPGEYVAAARVHQRALADAGLAGITWPQAYGGLGLGPEHRAAFDAEAAGYETFSALFTIGLGMCGPVLLALGTQEQRTRYLPPLLRADEVWCQLFSEPGAGSDLAALATRATPDGDGWRVSGQKVWTTYAHHSDRGLLLARTDPGKPKHRGITMFALDMAAPGVTTRPLRQATGDAEFNEVFLDDVRVGPEDVVGAVDEGWRAATLMLMNERVALADSPIGSPVTLEAVVALARRTGRAGDPVVRKAVADAYVAHQQVELFARRIAGEVSVGRDPGALASIGKLAAGRLATQVAALAMEVAGPDAVAWDPADPDGGLWAYGELYAPSLSIAGGTEQIQRTVLGERVLGLPREPSTDRDVPFRDLRRG